jgi:hypothetical protein
MRNEITLIKNNDKKDWSDLEWVQEFYEFLKGNSPESINEGKPLVKLSPNKAFNIIWYLQEHFALLPDTIEQCSVCKELYDSNSQGHHSDLTNKFYCSESCEPNRLYEREQKAEAKKR